MKSKSRSDRYWRFDPPDLSSAPRDAGPSFGRRPMMEGRWRWPNGCASGPCLHQPILALGRNLHRKKPKKQNTQVDVLPQRLERGVLQAAGTSRGGQFHQMEMHRYSDLTPRRLPRSSRLNVARVILNRQIGVARGCKTDRPAEASFPTQTTRVTLRSAPPPPLRLIERGIPESYHHQESETASPRKVKHTPVAITAGSTDAVVALPGAFRSFMRTVKKANDGKPRVATEVANKCGFMWKIVSRDPHLRGANKNACQCTACNACVASSDMIYVWHDV